MKLEYLKAGSDDCPLLRIYDGKDQDYDHLIDAIDNLLLGKESSVVINELIGFFPLNKITLEFILSEENFGVIEKSKGNFICALKFEDWSKIRNLIVSFIIDRKGKFNWLNETSAISLLLSDNGEW